MDKVVFHIVADAEWKAVASSHAYIPSGLETEGFIHLSRRHQILRPANLLYSGRSDLVLLEIVVAALTSELRYEPGSHGEDELFPHLYGQLNVGAVVAVHDFPCLPDGRFELPASVSQTDS